jgi:hypothetical protein
MIFPNNSTSIAARPSTRRRALLVTEPRVGDTQGAATLAIVRTLPVPDKPEFAVDGGNGEIYANIESDPGQMVVIDSRESRRQHL